MAAGIGVALVLALIAAARPSAFTRLDNAVYDALLRALPESAPDGQVVIVNVDERSLSALGQWPWPRARIAQLIENLRDLGASAIGMDVIFAEAERAQDPARSSDTTGRTDTVLARALREGRVVLGYAMTFESVEPKGRPCGATPLRVAVERSSQVSDSTSFFRATGGICNLPALVAAARAAGFLNAAPDRDGILRRAPLLVDYNGGMYPGLALSTVALATGAEVSAVRISTDQAGYVRLSNGTEIPTDGRGNLLLRYRGRRGTFPYVSAVDVLRRTIPEATLKDKIVLVGTTALGLREVVATPLDTQFAGVEVQATIADNLLAGDFIRRAGLSPLLEGLATFAFGVLMTLALINGRFTMGVLAALAGTSAAWAGATALLWLTGHYLSPLYATLAGPLVFASVVPLHATLDRRRADDEGQKRITAQRFMVQSLLSLTETRNLETGRHSRRTQELTRLLAEELAKHPDYHSYLTPNQIELISSLAPLHDIGKVGVPDSILNKAGRLTDAEVEVVKRHPAYGRDVIRNAEERVGVTDDVTLAVAKEIAYTHHERWDGKGYPEGLSGTNIPVAGRLMAVVDVYDATANRNNAYRGARMTHEESVNLITEGRGRHFDPAVVEAFLRVAPEFQRVSRQHVDFLAEMDRSGGGSNDREEAPAARRTGTDS